MFQKEVVCLFGKPEDDLEDPGIDGKKIFKLILK
jgi:hypothetical protein